MLIDRGEVGLRLGVVLIYRKAPPKEGFDGRMTRRHYCRPASFYSFYELPVATVKRQTTPERRTRELRAPDMPPGSLPITAHAGDGQGGRSHRVRASNGPSAGVSGRWRARAGGARACQRA